MVLSFVSVCSHSLVEVVEFSMVSVWRMTTGHSRKGRVAFPRTTHHNHNRTTAQNDSDDATIKRSYRKLALQLHPDKVQGTEEEKKAAADKFAQVSHAYEVLMDPEKRAVYDRYGEEGLKNHGAGGHAHPGDIFSQFFGGFGGFPFGGGFQEEQTPKGESVHMVLEVTLKDVYVGKEIRVTRDKHILRPAPGKRQCNCRQRMVTRQIGPGMFQQTPVKECEECDNVKLERKKDVLLVHVEPGMHDGEEIVFFEEGEPMLDGEHGDLVFHVQVQPHEVFTRRGDDLVMTLGVSLTEALGGFEKRIKHLDGHEVVLSRQGVTRPGDVMILEGEGMAVYGEGRGGTSTNGRGRLVVTVQVRFPEQLEKEAVEVIRGVLDVDGRVWGKVEGVVEGTRCVYTDDEDNGGDSDNGGGRNRGGNVGGKGDARTEL